eukprot:NODE_206_length_12919_cov_0.381357.p13 type:complete len:101 gc:universal NODE_206_length_12919_cov_0.381357:5932-5630(-)
MSANQIVYFRVFDIETRPAISIIRLIELFEFKSKNPEIVNLLLYGKVKDDYVDGMAIMNSNYNALKRQFNNLNEQEFIQNTKMNLKEHTTKLIFKALLLL